jgi:colanic acid biosynthesis glycosyl transferase WcaI
MFTFLFVGGGSEWAKVETFAKTNNLSNIRRLPYQPVEKLAGSLSAADLHVVVMGESFVGTIHPCKIYNIVLVGAPILYIGPASSHVADLFKEIGDQHSSFSVRHGENEATVAAIRAAADASFARCSRASGFIPNNLNRNVLLTRLVGSIEGH